MLPSCETPRRTFGDITARVADDLILESRPASDGTIELSGTDQNDISRFLAIEALKIPAEFWDLLPFNPQKEIERLGSEPRRSESTSVQDFKAAYRVACRLHGAPDMNNPDNNVIAARQFRDNGAAYIIHLIGTSWDALHVAQIVDPIVIETSIVHDSTEDGVGNIQKLANIQKRLPPSDSEARTLIDNEFDRLMSPLASRRVRRQLRAFERPSGTPYRLYLEHFVDGPLDELLFKLIDQTNNLVDIPYLVRESREYRERGDLANAVKYDHRARRQVGKTLRYFSGLITIERYRENPRYQRTVFHLMKTLIRVSESVGYLEPYYERAHGANAAIENLAIANQEILRGLDAYQRWLASPEFRLALIDGLSREDAVRWNASRDRFTQRIAALQERLHHGDATPAPYLSDVWRQRGLSDYILKLEFYMLPTDFEITSAAENDLTQTVEALGGYVEGMPHIDDPLTKRPIRLRCYIHTPLDRPFAEFEQQVQIRLQQKFPSLRLGPMPSIHSTEIYAASPKSFFLRPSNRDHSVDQRDRVESMLRKFPFKNYRSYNGKIYRQLISLDSVSRIELIRDDFVDLAYRIVDKAKGLDFVWMGSGTAVVSGAKHVKRSILSTNYVREVAVLINGTSRLGSPRLLHWHFYAPGDSSEKIRGQLLIRKITKLLKNFNEAHVVVSPLLGSVALMPADQLRAYWNARAVTVIYRPLGTSADVWANSHEVGINLRSLTSRERSLGALNILSWDELLTKDYIFPESVTDEHFAKTGRLSSHEQPLQQAA